MDARSGSEGTPTKDRTKVERTSDRELVVTRTVNGPARLVFEAWTTAELFRRWWVPRSYGLNLLSCDMDVRVGGEYRLVFRHQDSTMAFFGTYLEVTPHSRLAWTEAYRVLARPHFLGGWGLWDVQVGFRRRCVSARSGW